MQAKSVAPNQLAATFGAENARCLAQDSGPVMYVPQKTILQVQCPVNFVSYMESTQLLPVATPTQYKTITMNPQQQVANSPCRQEAPMAAPMAAPLVPDQGCNDCGNGSCRTGPYQSSPPMVVAERSPCGAAASACGGYAGVIPGGAGSQMAYAPPPAGSASYQAGMYSVGAMNGYASMY